MDAKKKAKMTAAKQRPVGGRRRSMPKPIAPTSRIATLTEVLRALTALAQLIGAILAGLWRGMGTGG